MTDASTDGETSAAGGGEPARPAPGAPHPQPVDPMDPLKREPDDPDEDHPGADPVVRPIPPG